MDYSLKSEKREYIRINTSSPVTFKFLGDEKNFPDMGKSFQGTLCSLNSLSLFRLLNGGTREQFPMGAFS